MRVAIYSLIKYIGCMEKVPDFKNTEHAKLEQKLRDFLTGAKIPLERGDPFQTVFNLSSEKRERISTSDIFTEEEKHTILSLS